MEALDSPNFAPAVQNYKQLRKPQTIVGAQTPLAQVQSSSLPLFCTNLFRAVGDARPYNADWVAQTILAQVRKFKSRRHSATPKSVKYRLTDLNSRSFACGETDNNCVLLLRQPCVVSF